MNRERRTLFALLVSLTLVRCEPARQPTVRVRFSGLTALRSTSNVALELFFTPTALTDAGSRGDGGVVEIRRLTQWSPSAGSTATFEHEFVPQVPEGTYSRVRAVATAATLCAERTQALPVATAQSTMPLTLSFESEASLDLALTAMAPSCR